MKQIKHRNLLLWVFVTFMTTLTIACSDDNDILTNEVQIIKMKFEGGIEEFDGIKTRATSSFPDGTKILVRFDGGAYGTATYNSSSDDWTFSKTGSLSTTSSSCTLYYSPNPKSVTDNKLTLDFCTPLYSAQGTYSYSSSVLKVTATLKPATPRVRFRSTTVKNISISGFAYYTGVDVSKSNPLTNSSSSIQLDVNSAYTAYIYVFFANTNRNLELTAEGKEYQRTIGSSMFTNGTSGWMDIPNPSSLGSWKEKYTIVYVTDINLNNSSLSMSVGDTQTLSATVYPSNATDKSITWSSSNLNVATVNNSGVITAKSAGSATITATANDGSGVKATCIVSVSPNLPSSKRTFTANGVSFDMILVEHGTFTMGATSEQGSDAFNDEKPAHQVTLTKDYYIGETEVTQALWKAVTGYSPTSDGRSWTSTYGLGNNYPAYFISYDDVKSFIIKLNSLTGKTFRMPTEAEWEFAARGGNKSKGYKYSGSNTIGDVAWYYDNNYFTTHQVKTKYPNELGIYDMSGNVYEWCSDWQDGGYSSSSQTNPTGPTSGSLRVYRGGSWASSAGRCRVSYRNSWASDYRTSDVGFRLALSE